MTKLEIKKFMEIIEQLDGCGLVITDDDLIKKTLEGI